MRGLARGCAIDSRDRWVEDDERNFRECYCPGCPTHDECMKAGGEKLYCARQTSKCEIVRRGCECGECTVAIRSRLSLNYYCQDGPARF